MTTLAALVDGPLPGMRALRREVAHAAWSPDGAWLAVADVPDADGRAEVRVLDPTDGREALCIPGREVLGVVFASSEHLLVVRAQELGARAVLHAVPDGAALATAPLANVPRVAVQLSRSATRHPDECAARVFVMPSRWPGGLRQGMRQRAGWVLALPSLDVVSRFEPDAWTALPRLPNVRAAAAVLAPDGDALAVWLESPGHAEPGSLWLQPADGGPPRRVCAVGRTVGDIVYAGPDRVLLRSADGPDTFAVVDLAARAPELDLSFAPGAAFAALGAVALHPDAHVAVVPGAALRDGVDADDAPPAFTVLDLDARAVARPAHVFAGRRAVGVSAAFTGDGHTVATLVGAAPRRVRIALHDALDDAPWSAATPSWTLPLDGTKPSSARLARAPDPIGLCVTWDVDAPRAPRGLPLPRAKRMAWIPREVVLSAVRR